MRQYLDLMRHVLENGTLKTDRTGTGTLSVFGHQMRFDLAEGFPLVTTKKLHLKSILHELLFFIRGETNQRALLEAGVTIWREWGDAGGNLGPVYSHQWRHFGGAHQNRPQPEPHLDPAFAPTVSGVGSRGGYVEGTDPVRDRLLALWQGMLERCYDPQQETYASFGGRGVSVCDRWLLFPTFAEDAARLPGWEEKRADWDGSQLDKDVSGDGFRYGPDTCLWLSRQANLPGKGRLIYRLAHDDGREATVQYPREFYGQRGTAQDDFCAMLRGEREQAGGWRLVSAHDPGEGVDQLRWVVEEIKRNPDSRRLIVSAWNPADVPFMALPPCHVLFQFYVQDGRLSCQLYQRSGDIFLGVPFNIASYALLTLMVAQVTGLEPGEFIHTLGDAHLYLNHVEQARTQLTREPRPLPTMHLDPAVTDLFAFRSGDFELRGYDPHPHIKAPVAV